MLNFLFERPQASNGATQGWQCLQGLGGCGCSCIALRVCERFDAKMHVHVLMLRKCALAGAALRPSVSLKRKAEECVDALTLHSALSERLGASTNLGTAVFGPSKSTRVLNIEGGVEQWLASARVAAIAGSCPRSHKELRSAVRAYVDFAYKVQCFELSPSIDMLMAWSNLFKCSRTFNNYVTLMRTAMQLIGLDTDGMHGALLKKAGNAIDKRLGYRPRKPMFIGFELVVKMVQQAAGSQHPLARQRAMCYLTCYTFLLRMPSECLPIKVATGGAADNKAQAVVSVREDCIELKLLRRKNMENGCVKKRTCWCRSCPITCPVHVLGRYFAELGAGRSAFEACSRHSILQSLRSSFQDLKVPEAAKYRTHDLRRGHGRDMQIGGASMYEILKAGDWRSPAFLAYMDKKELECGAVDEARLHDCLDESDGDET